MSDYTQGVCHDGAAILKDGMPLTIEEILEVLRERDQLDELLKAAGIDAQEIKAENELLRNEREALAAHVGWLDELRANVMQAISDDNLDVLDISFYRDDMQPPSPATSLACRDVRIKAEALVGLVMTARSEGRSLFSDDDLIVAADQYRKQAEGES